MADDIPFRTEKKIARLHDPRQGFALAEVEAEIRYHPPRLWLNPRLHVSDASHFQLLLGERFAMVPPESVAAELRGLLAA